MLGQGSMADMTMGGAVASDGKAPLGVGSILGESFSILFGNLFKVVLLTFGPLLVSLAISGALVGWSVAIGIGEPDFSGGAGVGGFGLSFLVQMVIYAVMTALLVQLAYDAKLDRPARLGRYFGPAMRAAIPIAVLSVVAVLLTMIGMIALIVPGLWIYAVFSVMAPAVTIEGSGFGGLGRSAALTKGYRWPILGALVLSAIVGILVNLVATFVVGMVAVAAGGFGMLAGVVLYAAMMALGYGFSSIVIALIYARLREIKEGIGIDRIVSVFE